MDQFDFVLTPQPDAKSICLVMDSDVSHKELHTTSSIKKDLFPASESILIPSDKDIGVKLTSASTGGKILNLQPRLLKSKKSSVIKKEVPQSVRGEKIYQPSSCTSLSHAKAFFTQLDATQNLKIDNTKYKNHDYNERSGKNNCVRTVRKRNLSEPSLLEGYASYKRASKESGLDPLALPIFALCQSEYFCKDRIYDGLLEED